MVAFLAACGDDDSWSPSDADNSRSSSVIQSDDSHEGSCSSSVNVIPGSDPESSSAEKQGSSSSSSVILSSSEVSSDSRSSDSKGNSSSSNKEESSSSKEFVESSSSLDDFDWSLPKEAYLNPEIQYDSIFDERDGQVYKTVKIGEQVWMAQNLNYETVNSWCGGGLYWSEGDCAIFGRLYTWADAIDSVKFASDTLNPQNCGYYGWPCTLPEKVQGICPTGWHLPSRAEWGILIRFAGGRDPGGPKLMSLIGWCSYATDDFGFSALPSGSRNENGYFGGNTPGASFWSSYQDGEDFAFHTILSGIDMSVIQFSFPKDYGFSVRCIKD